MRVRRFFRRYRLLLGPAVFVLAAASATAQQDIGWWGSHYTVGNVTFNAGIGLSPDPLALELYPGVETTVLKWRPANVFAVDFGVGTRGILGFRAGATQDHLVLGVGPYLSMHWGFRGLAGVTPFFGFLEPFDLFSTFGLSYLTYPRVDIDSELVFTNHSGFNFFLTDNFAVSLSSAYLHRFGVRTTLGVMYKIGPRESLGNRPVASRHLFFDYMYTMWFAWFEYDENFSVGDELTFRYTQPPGDERWMSDFEVTRTLLHRGADGTSWWRGEFYHADLKGNPVYATQYEFRVNDRWDVLEFRYQHPQTGQLRTEVPNDPSRWRGMLAGRREFADPSDVESYRVGSERITVPAGTVNTQVYRSAAAGDAEWTLWLSNDAPGLIVKFSGMATAVDMDEIATTGTEGVLQRVRRNVSSPWTPAW